MDEVRFFDPWAEIRQTANRLPHWQQRGATYFVTFHLADSVPNELRESLEQECEAWLKWHPEPWDAATQREYHRLFSGAVERWLDAGHGSCALRRPEVAVVVAECLGHFDGSRYVQHAWIVMPNHVHSLFSLHPDWRLEQVLHTWKSFTANRINELLARSDGCQPSGAPGRRPSQFWQRDYFDRLVRNSRHFANCVRYIRRNPTKANLRAGEFTLFESEFAKEIE